MTSFIQDLYDEQEVLSQEEKSDSSEEEINQTEKITKEIEKTPIFTLEKVKYRRPSDFVSVCVANNIMFLGCKNNLIIRINLGNSENLQDINFTNSRKPIIRKLFVDPTGRFLLISCRTGENFLYYHSKSSIKTPKISKLKSKIIGSVTWAKNNNDNKFRGLIGTTDGIIYEFQFHRNFNLKKLYTFSQNDRITGIYYQNIVANPKLMYVLVTTTNTLYQFVGGETVEQLFDSYKNKKPSNLTLPGELKKSEFHLNKNKGYANQFCWLTESGISFGNIIAKRNSKPGDNIIHEAKLVPYPKIPELMENEQIRNLPTPISIVRSDFHFILIYPDRLVAISNLDHIFIMEKVVDPKLDGKLIGVIQDPTTGDLWLFSSKSLYSIVKHNEDRDVWKIYLNREQYEVALEYCKGDNIKGDKVLIEHGKALYRKKNYLQSANILGKTTLPFERTAVKFMDLQSREPLKYFLSSKLDTLEEKPTSESIMITTWLLELYLEDLNYLEENKMEEKFVKAERGFHNFIKDKIKILNDQTTFELITSYDRMKEMVFYASLTKQFDRVISHHINQQDFDHAIKVIRNNSLLDMIYKYSPILMFSAPLKTIHCWKQFQNIEPSKLLPSLMRYNSGRNHNDKKPNYAIEYLEYCVHVINNKEQTIHNYLLSLYIEYNYDDKLMRFLNPVKGIKYYDPRYGLRLCMQNGKKEGSVFLYSEMGMYKEAVKLALTFDENLAKINANKPTDLILKKKLWSKVAKHIAKRTGDPRKAIEFFKDSETLEFENILPMIPQFKCIDEFRDDIIKSLKSFNKQIDEIQLDMEEDRNSAELIRKDLNHIRKNSVLVRFDEQKCQICDRLILNNDYYIFPCNHSFHVGCLTKEVKERFLSKALKRQLKFLSNVIKKEEKQLYIQNNNIEQSINKKTILEINSKIEKARNDYDRIVASQCIECGNFSSKIVETSFFDYSNKKMINSWKL
ncbi:vacuolar protein sorting-associated protein 18 [Anaeramoeba flamelloides]|uniref:Vacuolar protein sorting-associated protein 18 n=1 Tax=Anaeramoeba flamelloides TaxID=1746091 RepID=A0AAV7ZNI0_9EUKA|nr:vacuolar protein sorting-associated protein 18 [Anaeramoeba flamelloides]